MGCKDLYLIFLHSLSLVGLTALYHSSYFVKILLLARLQRSNPIYSTNMSAPAEEPYELFPIPEIDTPLIQGKHRSSIREYVQRHMKSVPSLTCPSIFATVFKVFRHSIPSWISFLLAVAFYVLTVLYAWRPELVSRIELFGGSPAKAIRLLAILSGIRKFNADGNDFTFV